MQEREIRRGCAWTLAALMLFPALPAVAGEPAPAARFELDLEPALEAQGSSFGLAHDAAAQSGAERAAAPTIRLSELRAAAWALDEGEEDPAARMKPEKRGLGRWLKKRWYVPVLAAAVLAVAFDDDDNDATGEED